MIGFIGAFCPIFLIGEITVIWHSCPKYVRVKMYTYTLNTILITILLRMMGCFTLLLNISKLF
jgi:hypothetical protein